MKRVGYLFERIISFENLLKAARQAASGKKEQIRVAHFLFHLENELLGLQAELEQNIWQPGGFRVFEIREPKPRRISAADFRDRVVHHALCNILEPVFDKRLIFDTWACRKGKGSHRAVKRAQYFCRHYPFFLKCDIRKYFDSVDHSVLKDILRRILKDKNVLSILDKVIDNPLPGPLPGKGLPIGNLTSQHFANLYLGELDHEIKDRQGIRPYLRYMDDMLFFAKTKKELRALLVRTADFLQDRLRLALNPVATKIAPVTEGVPFLGFRIFPNLIRLNSRSLRRYRKRLRQMESAYESSKTDVDGLTASIQSMIAHMSHGDTLRLRQSMLPCSMASG